MRRKLIQGILAGLAVPATFGLVVITSQQGLFEGKARHLLTLAIKAQQAGNMSSAQAHLEELITTFPDSPWTGEGMLQLGQVYSAQKQFVEAQRVYRTFIERFPESSLLAKAEEQLGQINVALLFSPLVTEMDSVHEVKPQETLGRIASVDGTTVDLLKRANGLSSDLIHPGQKLKVPKARFRVVVDKSQNRLTLTSNDQLVKSYTVSTGKDDATPSGTFKIVNRIIHPVWYKQGAIVPPDSPENILGSRWLGFDKPGYGIHGTTEPQTLGQSVTAGCVRMANNDVEELFAIVPVGTEVTIVD